MPQEEALPGVRRSLGISPSRNLSSGSARLYGAVAAAGQQAPQPQPQLQSRPSRLSHAPKKTPESLRRAVADSLSPPSLHQYGSGGNVAAAAATEAARNLRDYISNPLTVDMAYSALIDHAVAEQDRSPAVVPRCVALLKRYLVRYVPAMKTLKQIDIFCMATIVKCDSLANQSLSLSQYYRVPAVPTSSYFSTTKSNISSAGLVKSLNYVRSLVGRHIPKLSFQPIGQALSSASMKQSLPSLSTYFSSRSFTSQISPEVIIGRENLEYAEPSNSSVLRTSSNGEVDAGESGDGLKYVSSEVIKWRWHIDSKRRTFVNDGDDTTRLEDFQAHGFFEVGAAALLSGVINASMMAPELSNISLSQFLTGAGGDFAAPPSHLKAITASKRMKDVPSQVWTNVPANTFQPRARPLFQYKHYSEQQPLKLSPAEIYEVIAEICSESSSPTPNLSAAPLRLANQGRQPAADVAFSVLIKLVIDMYMMDSENAAPLTLFMLEGLLSSKKTISRMRAFDLILNLGIHAQLLGSKRLERTENGVVMGETEPANSYIQVEEEMGIRHISDDLERQHDVTAAIDNFETWLLHVLFDTLLLLVQMEEQEESIWAAALSCLFYFVCDKGKILRGRLHGLDIRVVKALLEIAREHSWAKVVRSKLICMLTNLLYNVADGSTNHALDSEFLADKVDLLGGVDYLCLEYSRANSSEEKCDLFFVIFDYVVHQINEACLVSGVSTYAYDDVQPLASLLALADAPEAFYISVKHSVGGIGDMLRAAISTAFSSSPEYEHLNLLLEKITRKLDATVGSFSRIDNEFSFMIQITRSYKSVRGIDDDCEDEDTAARARLSWATLHSLLHSGTVAYRHHGYTWLVELLLSEITEDPDSSVLLSIKRLQQQIEDVGSQESPFSEVPLSVCLLCGLLKSKHNYIRRGFLFVLEKFLLRCKLLLDETDVQQMNYDLPAAFDSNRRADEAIAVVDMMSSALSLVVSRNETDHINILEMCEMLFTQLCLRLPTSEDSPDDHKSPDSSCVNNKGIDVKGSILQKSVDSTNSWRNELSSLASSNQNLQPAMSCATTSMAALLLQGQAIAPMQLVSRVPVSLFDWPLIQLAGAATDDIALGVAVGSNGRGNLPGATSDIRAALLLLLVSKCSADQDAFMELEGKEFFKEFFRGLLDDTDSRIAYFSAAFLLKRMMTEEADTYQRMLQSLISKAQQSNNEKLLENPYLQMRGILQLSIDIGAQ